MTDYLWGYQYQDGVLQFLTTPEGYLKNTVTPTGNSYNYVFTFKDHLGNSRVSYGMDPVDNVLKIMEDNAYYPFGMSHEGYNETRQTYLSTQNGVVIGTPGPLGNGMLSYKYKFNGKELQDELGLNVYDYGARNYDPAIGRWMNIDPLAEESRRWSPYTYAMNSPIYFIDPDGMSASPIYGTDGSFLGTDEDGLKGLAVVMKKENFVQGMSREDAEKNSTYTDTSDPNYGFDNKEAAEKYGNHYANLKNRPDFDGKVTRSEANDWYAKGTEEPLFVDAAKINLSPVETDDFTEGVGSSILNNFILSTNQETGQMYGTIRLTLDNAEGTVTLGKDGYLDTYDFDQKPRNGTIGRDLRNIATKAGEIVAGKGKPFDIYVYGKGKVEKTE